VTFSQPSFLISSRRLAPAVCRFAFLAVALCSLVLAQIPTGGIAGRVVDPTGAVIGQAKVSVKDPGTDVTRTVETSADGSFRVDGLEAGTYDLGVSAKGLPSCTGWLRFAWVR